MLPRVVDISKVFSVTKSRVPSTASNVRNYGTLAACAKPNIFQPIGVPREQLTLSAQQDKIL
jgi:hypothetical protein